jgi:hypothetical protein
VGGVGAFAPQKRLVGGHHPVSVVEGYPSVRHEFATDVRLPD